MASGDGPSGSTADDDIGLAETVHPEQPDLKEAPTLGGRPQPDKLHRAVARARIADKLFAKKEEVKVGRFHLLEMVGSGGMGVVWGAWDPQLDRRVAIKLVRAEMSEAARERIKMEGQLLARLSHPNVVPVFDVGVLDDQVYLVMEWVRGKTFRAYCKEPRTIREILAIYRAAGEGLAAAHAAGLIHRDFKPENAMVGDDGRVRVLDFGLARAEARAPEPESDPAAVSAASSDLTRGAGTPRYMPPEQADGKELTPAVDQYAFCVSLRETLAGRNADGKAADVPRWLDDILDRGTAHDRGKRYDSMAALLRALANDPATVWRRRLLVAGALGAAGIAFAVGTLRGGAEVERCVGGKDEIAKTWNPAVRARLTAHLRSLGPYGTQEAQRLDDELTRYSERWASAHRGACMAKDRGELTPDLYARNLSCLVRSRAALDTVVEVLGSVEVERLPDAVVAAHGIPNAERCISETQSTVIAPPPRALEVTTTQLASDVESARILAVAVEPRAVPRASETAARAVALGYLPLVARAHLVHGYALLLQDQRNGAIQALQLATTAALEASDMATATEAYARQIWAIANATEEADLPPNAKDSLQAVAVMEAIARGLGPGGAFARALLYNNLGTVRLTAGDPGEARRWFARALAESEHATAGGVELSSILGNLALVTSAREERDRFLAKEGAILGRELGPDHPVALDSRVNAGILMENPRESLSAMRAPCRRYQDIHRHLEEKISLCSYELGWLAEELSEPAEARSAMRAVSIAGGEQQIAAGYLLMLDGELAAAAREMHRVAAELSSREHVWPRFRAADALVIAALCERQLGREATAIETLRKARAALEHVKFLDGRSFYQRRLARTQALLAQWLVKLDPAGARQHAREALAWYRTVVGGYEDVVARLDAIAPTGSP